jgi:hypothetical protein
LLNFLDLKPTGHVVAKQADGHYVWLTLGRKAYSTWWHGSPRAGNQDVEIGRDCYNESVIAPGVTGMEVPLLSFGVGLMSPGYR